MGCGGGEGREGGLVQMHQPLMNCVVAQNYWFTYNEPMSVESVTQSVSNLALRFSEDDKEEEDGMGRGSSW